MRNSLWSGAFVLGCGLLCSAGGGGGSTGSVTATVSAPQRPLQRFVPASGCLDNFPTPPGMVAIPAGTFEMGSSAAPGLPYVGHANTQPVHQVTIGACFWMGETEVTQAQYEALMGTNPSAFVAPQHPVEQVSWVDARAYCAALTAQQAALGHVPAGYEYRLPTEAEWEYACRAGSSTEFSTGSELHCEQARFGYSYHSSSFCGTEATAPVRSHAPNPWGLFDMHGNVFEWCLDSRAPYGPDPVVDPFVTGGSERVARGGAWAFGSSTCRSAYRAFSIPRGEANSIGFRVTLAPILVP